MGHPDGAHSHGSGGSGLGELVVILLAVALLGPAVAAAVAELVHILLIIAAVLAGTGAAGLAALLVFRARRTLKGTARAEPPNRGAVSPLHRMARAAQPLPPRQRPAIERVPEVHVHHHWHGVDAEDVAEILYRQLP